MVIVFAFHPPCGSGEGGVDGDGDITRPENISAFRNFIMESTERRGLHFLMADGVSWSLHRTVSSLAKGLVRRVLIGRV